MYPIVLITVLIFVPVAIGAGCAVVGFRTYRTRRQFQHDIEHAQNTHGMPPTSANTIELRELETTTSHRSWPLSHRSWPLSRHRPDIVPPNLAPSVKPLPPPKTEIEGVGGGFVEHWGPNSSITSPVMPDADTRYEHTCRHVNKQENEKDDLENADSHSKQRDVSDIPAPQPMYTSALYGRYGSAASPTTRMYGEDARAADVWAKIERREALVKSRAHELSSAEKFEDVDLDGDEGWRRVTVPDRPVFAVGSGSSEDEHTGYTPMHTPEPRRSFGSARSFMHSRAFPAAERGARKASWSTASSHCSRRSVDCPRENSDEVQESVRRSYSSTSKKAATVNSSTSKKANVVNPFADRASSELRCAELVGYSDSDEETPR